jgi:hypothetical protein
VTWTARVTEATGYLNLVNFESGDLSQTAGQTNAAIVPSPALNGNYSVQLNRNNSVSNVEIRQSGTTYYNLPTVFYSFLFEYASNPGDGSVVNFQDTASGYKAAIHLSPSDQLEFFNINGTLLATGSTVLQPNTPYTISARIGSGSNAAWQILLNGNVELSGTGNFGSSNNGSIKLGGDNPYTANYYYDDVQINFRGYPGPVPTGTVQFAVDGGTLGGPVPLSDGIATSPSDSTLPFGMHTITATYDGDTTFFSSISEPFREIVNQAATRTILSSSVNPSVFGQPVIFTANVIAAIAAAGPPTGAVTFLDGGTPIGAGFLDAAGQATFTTAALAVGPHTITAQYGGDLDLTGSNSVPFTATVNQAATLTIIRASVNALALGQPVTFTATVLPILPAIGIPAGTVTFFDGGTPIGTAAVDATGQASFLVSRLLVGTHTITATYSGNSNFLTSTSSGPLALSVAAADTITTLVSSANASVFGQPVTFTASVAATGPGTPTGMITFKDGTSILGTVPLNSSGIARFSPTTPLAVGTHSITAVYNGDYSFLSSTSAVLTQTITLAATQIVLTSSANPSSSIAVVTFTVTVTAVALGTGTPTGTVTLRDGTTTLGTALLSPSGTATFGVVVAPAGTHSITAVYGGDGGYAGSTSVVQSQVANGVANQLLPNPATPATPTPSSPSSASASQASATSSTPPSQSSATPPVDTGFIGPAGNGVLLRVAGAVIGQVSTSSGATLSAESLRALESRAGGAAGPGSGSHDAGQRPDLRPGDGLLPGFEPGLPATNDLLSGIDDLADSLLTGRPGADLQPQKGTSIAPVAMVVPGDAGDDPESAPDALTEEQLPWPDFVIGLDDTIDRGPEVVPEKAPDGNGAARAPANWRNFVDQVFERWSPAVLQEMISQPAPEQAGTLATMLAAALLLTGIWQTRRRARPTDGRVSGCVPRTESVRKE